MSATITGTVLLVDAVATELADTAVLAANASSPAEISHARARVLGDAIDAESNTCASPESMVLDFGKYIGRKLGDVPFEYVLFLTQWRWR
jgi:hypothetical protein